MKNMITMMIGIVIGAITILIILTVTGRMNYATELESQLPAVVENILCNVKIKQLYNVVDNQEFTADVTEQIAKELDAQTGIVMRIMGADKEKGLFSVGVDLSLIHILQFLKYQPLMRRFLLTELYADSLKPEGNLEEMVVQVQWIAMEYACLLYTSRCV